MGILRILKNIWKTLKGGVEKILRNVQARGRKFVSYSNRRKIFSGFDVKVIPICVWNI